MTESQDMDCTSKPPPSALDHLKVLDLSRVLAGPWATQILGDLGADVVKVESPDKGDDTRGWGPPFLATASGAPGDAAYFTACNRNKRSLTIDFSNPEGAALVRRLAAEADVLVENFKLGGLAKFGLDYETLKAVNPKLVYCSVTGFGQTGPYAHRAGYDFLIQGMGGLMSVTGQPDGAPGAEPMKVGVAVADLFTGMYATVAILAALAHRDRTGEGQHIDCALLDCQVAMLANQGANWLVGQRRPGRLGNNHPNVVPYRVFAASDGFVIVACGNDGQFRRLCAALGDDSLAEDSRFQTNAGRIEHRELIDGALAALIAPRSRDEVVASLESVQVPCGPINDVPDVFADRHIKARGLEIGLTREDGQTIPMVGFPVALSATPASYRLAPARLGADTEAVLGEWLGIEAEGLEALRDKGAL
jgi:crotonobetainyl-CoA:carnitine CoA-transferase CaiB-like acyl-CoA transferase